MQFVKTLAILLACVCSILNAAPQQKWVRDIEETPGLFEGDIILPPSIENGLIDEVYRWPNATVVYELDPTFMVDELAKIYAGWAEITNTTCIKFRPKGPSDTNYVMVRRGAEGTGCSSSVGMRGGQQGMNLEAPSCTNRHGTIIHEMLHAIGFYHEQSRPDRDDYLTVVWDKIEPGKEHNFNKYPEDTVTTLGAPYDYGSVLHYSARGFSIDGNDTLVPKIPGVTIGQRLQISQLDAGKVRLMYNCPDEW